MHQHAELAWVFNCVARMGWMNRMTQWKDKTAGKNAEAESLGLFAYPSLMAADILLYKATHVPVGDDQKQHLELTRDIAAKFNNDYARLAQGAGARRRLLPHHRAGDRRARRRASCRSRTRSKKMSKSDPSEGARILLMDDADAIAKKIKRATTDPEPLPSEEKGLEGRAEADNLVGIYAALSDTTKAEVLQPVRRPGLGRLQAGARRSRGRQARPDRRRNPPPGRRPGHHRCLHGRRRRARRGHRRARP